MGSGLKVLAYTSATASQTAASRSRLLPRFARNRLLYLPEKAEPIRSSSRLELRTMSGLSPMSSRATARPFMTSLGSSEFLNAWTMCGYSFRTCSTSRYFRLWMSCRWLRSRKARRPSDVMYHVFGILNDPIASAYSSERRTMW